MSMHNRFSPHTISEFFAWMAPHFEKARSRAAEYLDHGQSDIPFDIRALFEAIMALDARINELDAKLDSIQSLLGVEPETK